MPGNDRLHLEYGGGLYGQATRFAMLSRKLCFGRGEGLPGKAWEQGQPLLLKQFEGSYFQRTAAAHAEGLTGALALPIFAGEYLNAVLVVFFGDGDDHAGAIELWRNDPAESKDMALADGHYGTHGRGLRVPVAAHRVPPRHGLAGPGLGQRPAGVPGRPGQGLALPAQRQAPCRSASTAALRCPAPAATASTMWWRCCRR